MQASCAIQDNRGVATSLIEAVVVMAIVTIIASVAVAAGVDRIENARLTKAVSETEMIGMATINFMQDTGGVPPAYKSGQATSPGDDVFFVLETEGDDSFDETDSWPTELEERGSFANHLITNTPSDLEPSYLRRGEVSFDRQRGWNGPYLASMPSADPWANRYILNVQFLTPQGVDLVREDLEVPAGGRVAVFVVSPGPNRTLETAFDQLDDEFAVVGDDIIFRIQ